METGVIRSPVPSYTAIAPETRAPAGNEPAAKTDLPASQTVTPSAEGTRANETATSGSSRYERDIQASSTELVRDNKLDPESGSMVYYAVDEETGEVVRQVPSETLRRLRAYAKALSDDTQTSAQILSRTA